MDDLTRRYYETHGRDVGETYATLSSQMRRYYAMTFPAGARVLDIGAGVGRDVADLVSEGYQAWGVEPSAAFREMALLRFPQIGDRIRAGGLPDEMPAIGELGGPFDGVLCSAVLQHVPRARLFDAVFAIKALLKERGRILLTVPTARPGIVDSRDTYGRLFSGVTPDELELLFERAGFSPVGRWEGDDAQFDRRPGHRWATLALELRTAGASRPIDHIEAVLSPRERKVATYKLALIRALCSIALTEPRRAVFGNDGFVRVPLTAIAERWVLYYWPLFESEMFLPQMNGEWTNKRHRLKFSKPLAAMISHYRRRGGLGAFATDQRAGCISQEATDLQRDLLESVKNAIRQGPAIHAGGSLPTRMFGLEPNHLVVAAELWRELSLTGHWIQDVTLIRWAERVADHAKGEVTADAAIARLMVTPDVVRETNAARSLYLRQPALECVWTGQSLSARSLAIDHVMPYSLWRNNDLWNLLPSHSKVNGTKSDKLPTRELLRARRDAIAHCWSLAREAFPRRFAAEARAQTGLESADLAALFDALAEAVEVTAIQRACPRWKP